jgi:Predicted O-methyltransferase
MFKTHRKVARENIENAGLSSKIQVIVGPAIDTLKTLHPEHPFDLVFIDADKPSNVNYFTEAKRLVRKGGVIVRGSGFREYKYSQMI